MGSFFQDALGDKMIGGGQMTLTYRRILRIDGEITHQERTRQFVAQKSIQPLSPDEAQLMGFGDYGTNEFITIYTLKKIPMPSKKGEVVIVKFNKKDWYVRRVLPWVWDEGTPFQMGYWEVTLSRFNETEVNPD